MPYFAPRSKETTLQCPDCSHTLTIARTCHEVYMTCPNCRKEFPLEQFIARADAAMEEFLENVYVNRI